MHFTGETDYSSRVVRPLTTLGCFVRAQNIQTLVIAAATRRLGWKSVAVFREGWGKAFVDQLLTLKVGIMGEVVSAATPAAVRSVAATKVAHVVKTTGPAVWVLWSDFWCHHFPRTAHKLTAHPLCKA